MHVVHSEFLHKNLPLLHCLPDSQGGGGGLVVSNWLEVDQFLVEVTS